MAYVIGVGVSSTKDEFLYSTDLVHAQGCNLVRAKRFGHTVDIVYANQCPCQEHIVVQLGNRNGLGDETLPESLEDAFVANLGGSNLMTLPSHIFLFR